MPRRLPCRMLLLTALWLSVAVRAEAADGAPAPVPDADADADAAEQTVIAPADAAGDAADAVAAAGSPPQRVRGPRAAVVPGPERQRYWMRRHLGLQQRAPGERQPVAQPGGLVELPGADGPLLALTHAARGDALLGRVVLLAHGAGAALEGRMGRLHRYLREHGWNVLTLPLPPQPAAALPERNRERVGLAAWSALQAPLAATDDAAATAAEAVTAAAEEPEAAEESAATEEPATAEAPVAAEQPVAAASPEAGSGVDGPAPVAQGDPAVPWPEQVAARVQLALDAMGGGDDNRNVVVAEGVAGAAALALARRAAVDVGVVWLRPRPLPGLDLGTATEVQGKGAVQLLALGAPGQDLGWLQERISGVRVTAIPVAAEARARDDDRINRRIRGWLERRVRRPD